MTDWLKHWITEPVAVVIAAFAAVAVLWKSGRSVVRVIASAMVGICGTGVAFWFGAIPTSVIPFSQMSPLALVCFGAVLWNLREMAHD